MSRSLEVVLVVVVLAVALSLSAIGSPSVPEQRPAALDGYRVVYRLEDRTSRPARIATEVLEVRRPYDGILLTHSGPTAEGQISTGQVTNREAFWQLYVGGELQFGVRRMPGGPVRDASYAVLREAAKKKMALAMGAGSVLGRPCAWFAFAMPAPQRLNRPTGESRVESCVTPAGVVLQEVWTLRGRVARIVRALSVTTSTPSRRLFLYGLDPLKEKVRQPDAAKLLRQQFVVDDEASVEAPIEVRAPAGWRRDRTAVASQAAGTTATQVVSETYLRGTQLVVVERGVHPSLRPTWPLDEGEEIDLGRLGDGRIVYFQDRVELRLTGDFGLVRIAAPSLRDALAFSRGLRQAG
ncbi:MAG TPA: hypothetical protein VFA34_05360 [Actinomycetota bacterium]|jgi:hypothetical protein|nr:hypothetical protein [Actinomycetota bacterium]